MKDTEDKIPDITNLATITTLNGKINEIKNEVPSITTLVKTSALNAKTNEVKNKIFNTASLATDTVLTAFENKIPDHSKYIATPEFSDKVNSRKFYCKIKTSKFGS